MHADLRQSQRHGGNRSAGRSESKIAPFTPGFLLLSLTLGGCAGATASDPAATPHPVTVLVSMYSGREDPTFTLPADQADQLKTCLTNRTGRPTSAKPADGLGFRYFEVRGIGDTTLLVGRGGAWLGGVGTATPVAVCTQAFTLLREAAFTALRPGDADAIPEG